MLPRETYKSNLSHYSRPLGPGDGHEAISRHKRFFAILKFKTGSALRKIKSRFSLEGDCVAAETATSKVDSILRNAIGGSGDNREFNILTGDFLRHLPVLRTLPHRRVWTA